MKTSKLMAGVFTVSLVLVLGLVAYAPAAEKPPIKVGVIFSITGPYSGMGTHQMNGVTMLFEEKNFQVAGRKIKLVYSDDGTKPDIALTRTKELVEFEQVNVLFGYISTAVGYAVRDFLHQSKTPTLSSSSGVRFTRDLFSPYIFRCSASTYQHSYEAAKWYARRGFKKLIWVGANYAGPREAYVGFKKGLEEEGGKIVQEMWPPLGIPDYGPYLSALKIGEADAIATAVWGADATRFVNQWAEYGLNKRIPLVGEASLIDEADTLPGMGTNAVGVLSCFLACTNSDVPGNKEFVEAYKKRFKSLPAALAYASYASAKAGYIALEKVKGNIEDKEKFLQAVKEVKFASPMGGITSFDERHGMVFDLVVIEVRKVNGGVGAFEVGRIKNVKDRYDLFPE